jgi:hypothetical protein
VRGSPGEYTYTREHRLSTPSNLERVEIERRGKESTTLGTIHGRVHAYVNEVAGRCHYRRDAVRDEPFSNLGFARERDDIEAGVLHHGEQNGAPAGNELRPAV